MPASEGTRFLLGSPSSRTCTHKQKNTGFKATCQIDRGSRRCFYQKVKQEVKNLIPPLPDKY